MKITKASDKALNEAIALRRILHKNPELSGKENETRDTIRTFFERFIPGAKLSNCAETGLFAEFIFSDSGQTVIFRADIDALPIEENINKFYNSSRKGVSHKCGHDGHVAILLALALMLKEQPLNYGRVVLLFQPSEENGTGAKDIIKDPAFVEITKDYIFGFHNLPGFPEGLICIAPNLFASASIGLSVKLKGKSSHAAYPEEGNSPAQAMADMIRQLEILNDNIERYSNFVLLTIVHANLGEKSFGTAPGEAEICATLRSFDDENMKKLCYDASLVVKEIADSYELDISIAWHDAFDATINHPEACRIIDDAADFCELPKKYISVPFRWSEDFGQYLKTIPGAMFGIGAGTNCPDLHTADYDFPDEIINPASEILYTIAENASKPKL